ncbi:MAG TPA: hypothetical protein VK747_13110, partial [Blastocatellia bacterium]|nr:hypothetical protein [Blastocatellia bacterium]
RPVPSMTVAPTITLELTMSEWTREAELKLAEMQMASATGRKPVRTSLVIICKHLDLSLGSAI